MPPTGPWPQWVAAKAGKLKARGRWREIRERPRPSEPGLVNFASNDYLGLSQHPGVIAAGQKALALWGAGSGASRLVCGTLPVHLELEEALAAWKATEAALVFPSGYMANVGLLSALAGPGTLICSDALNHASIVDGCRLASANGAVVSTYDHLDMSSLRRALAAPSERVLVVSDSVFSMDGDVAPVAELASLCADHGALLVLDEAHAVLGPLSTGLPGQVVRVGTLSKTLGSLGGFVAGDRSITELLVNRCRPFIYTTALSPADSASALAALTVLRSPSGEALVERLASHVRQLGASPQQWSPIIPIVLGREDAAVAASSWLASKGIWAPAIRPPTVPPGSSRLRLSLSAAHTAAEVAYLQDCLAELGQPPGG